MRFDSVKGEFCQRLQLFPECPNSERILNDNSKKELFTLRELNFYSEILCIEG